MINADLAEQFSRRADLVAQVVARHHQDVEVVSDVLAEMRGACESSGYCGHRCAQCLRGIHRCGHKRGCHVLCKSL